MALQNTDKQIQFDSLSKKEKAKIRREYLKSCPQNIVFVCVLCFSCLVALVSLVFIFMFMASNFENWNYFYMFFISGGIFSVISGTCLFFILPGIDKKYNSWLRDTKNFVVTEK